MSGWRDRLRLLRHHARFRLDEWRLPARPLPARTSPLQVNVVVHAERLARPEAFEALLRFAEGFRARAGVPLLCCITTPACPWVALQCAQEGLDDAGYARRVRELAAVADLGYHGHFFRPAADPAAARRIYDRDFGSGGDAFFSEEWECRLEPIGPSNHDAEAVAQQMDAELAWFAAEGWRPRVYLGGWWYMTPDIASRLDQKGFLADCTLRRGHANTFGGRYLEDSAIPARGTPWILPPARGLAEIQSVFYPVESPKRLQASYEALLGDAPGALRAVVLPLHEGEVLCFASEIRAHMDFLSRAGAAWTRVEDMATACRAACGIGGA